MEIAFLIEKDDLGALSDYWTAASETARHVQGMLRYGLGGAFVLMGVPFLCLGVGNHSTSTLIGGVIFLTAAVVWLLFGPLLWRLQLRSANYRAYSEGENPTVFGRQRLRILDDMLVVTFEYGENRLKWPAVQKIATTDSHTFIFVSAVAAYVIPKHKIISGDYDAFVAAARERFEHAHAGQPQ